MKLNYTLAWFDRFIISADANPEMLMLNLAYTNTFHSQKILIHKT